MSRQVQVDRTYLSNCRELSDRRRQIEHDFNHRHISFFTYAKEIQRLEEMADENEYAHEMDLENLERDAAREDLRQEISNTLHQLDQVMAFNQQQPIFVERPRQSLPLGRPSAPRGTRPRTRIGNLPSEGTRTTTTVTTTERIVDSEDDIDDDGRRGGRRDGAARRFDRARGGRREERVTIDDSADDEDDSYDD